MSASVTSMRSTSVALYSRGLAIGRDASTAPARRSRRAVGAGRLVECVPRGLAGVLDPAHRVRGRLVGVGEVVRRSACLSASIRFVASSSRICSTCSFSLTSARPASVSGNASARSSRSACGWVPIDLVLGRAAFRYGPAGAPRTRASACATSFAVFDRVLDLVDLVDLLVGELLALVVAAGSRWSTRCFAALSALARLAAALCRDHRAARQASAMHDDAIESSRCSLLGGGRRRRRARRNLRCSTRRRARTASGASTSPVAGSIVTTVPSRGSIATATS